MSVAVLMWRMTERADVMLRSVIRAAPSQNGDRDSPPMRMSSLPK